MEPDRYTLDLGAYVLSKQQWLSTLFDSHKMLEFMAAMGHNIRRDDDHQAWSNIIIKYDDKHWIPIVKWTFNETGTQNIYIRKEFLIVAREWGLFNSPLDNA